VIVHPYQEHSIRRLGAQTMLPGRVIAFAGRESRSLRAERIHKILQVGRDSELLGLRAKVLCSAGYTVHSTTPDQAPAELRMANGAVVWVFCHTLEFYELALLAVAIRNARPADKLLRMNNLNDIGQLPGLFDGFIEPADGVDKLLQALADLAKNDL
jgi:hypothetical protein